MEDGRISGMTTSPHFVLAPLSHAHEWPPSRAPWPLSVILRSRIARLQAIDEESASCCAASRASCKTIAAAASPAS